jgi:hypothetical protein
LPQLTLGPVPVAPDVVVEPVELQAAPPKIIDGTATPLQSTVRNFLCDTPVEFRFDPGDPFGEPQSHGPGKVRFVELWKVEVPIPALDTTALKVDVPQSFDAVAVKLSSNGPRVHPAQPVDFKIFAAEGEPAR